jgi:urocanate hydratase
MEKELIMNEEMETEMALDTYDEPEVQGRGLGKIIAIGGTALVGGAAALAIKNKKKLAAKIEDHKIKKLEKKGYVVYKPEEVEAVEVDSEDVETVEE